MDPRLSDDYIRKLWDDNARSGVAIDISYWKCNTYLKKDNTYEGVSTQES